MHASPAGFIISFDGAGNAFDDAHGGIVGMCYDPLDIHQHLRVYIARRGWRGLRLRSRCHLSAPLLRSWPPPNVARS